MNIILFDSGCTRFGGKDERYRHIRDVLRLREGDSFRAGIINGDRGMATITDFGPDGLSFSFAPEGPDSSLFPLYVILAAVRPICMKRILRELVSLGTGRLVICASELGERSYLDSGLYRSGEYRDIMLSGAMQSGIQGLLTQHPELIQNPQFMALLQALGSADIATPLNNLGNALVDAFRTDTRNMYGGALTLTQPLYMGGKIRAYNKITRYAEELARQQHNSGMQDVILSTDQAYWQVVSLEPKEWLPKPTDCR